MVATPASAATPVPALRRAAVALRVAARVPRLVLGADVVVQQLTDATVAPIPLCAPWFRGVARHGSQIVPVFDVATWAGVGGGSADVVVALAAGARVMGLVACESPALAVYERPPAAWPGQDLWLAADPAAQDFLFDPWAWLASVAPALELR